MIAHSVYQIGKADLPWFLQCLSDVPGQAIVLLQISSESGLEAGVHGQNGGFHGWDAAGSAVFRECLA
jgi:hypothetical protein